MYVFSSVKSFTTFRHRYCYKFSRVVSVSPSIDINPGGEIDGRSVKIVTPSVATSLELEQWGSYNKNKKREDIYYCYNAYGMIWKWRSSEYISRARLVQQVDFLPRTGEAHVFDWVSGRDTFNKCRRFVTEQPGHRVAGRLACTGLGKFTAHSWPAEP